MIPNADPSVPAGHKNELSVNPQWEVHPLQVKEALDKQEQIFLLDVRRPDEWKKGHLPGATLLPLQELGARVEELSAQRAARVVVYCHHGSRSLHATAFLRKSGFENVHSMAGGTDAYSLMADASLPRY